MSEEFEELPFAEEKKTDESSENTTISLYFENTIGPSSRKEKLSVNTEMPVADLKYTLSEIFNLPSDEFHLIHGGMTMDNEDLLSNFNLIEGDVLLIIPVTTAG